MVDTARRTEEQPHGPASIVPLRQYKPQHRTEEEIVRELAALGKKITEGARDVEGTKFAQLTILAADYVDLKMRETNDRETIKERDIRNFVKGAIGYGDEKGRVAAAERSSTIEALLGISAMAAFLYHHAFNGCDIRYFVGNEPAKEKEKGSVPRLAMPFNQWLPRIQILGSEVKRVDNPDATYRPLPAWAIRAQYQLMLGGPKAKLDPNTGRLVRQGADRPSTTQKRLNEMEQALKQGEANDETVLTAASMLVTALRNHPEAINDKTADALTWLYEILDRRFSAEEEATSGKGRKAKRA